MAEFQQTERKLEALTGSLDIKELNRLAFSGDCSGLNAGLSSVGSVENQIAALQAMSLESKGKTGLPELELLYEAEKQSASLKLALIQKEPGAWLTGGKLVYSMTYDPRQQSIKTWCRSEKR